LPKWFLKIRRAVDRDAMGKQPVSLRTKLHVPGAQHRVDVQRGAEALAGIEQQDRPVIDGRLRQRRSPQGGRNRTRVRRSGCVAAGMQDHHDHCHDENRHTTQPEDASGVPLVSWDPEGIDCCDRQGNGSGDQKDNAQPTALKRLDEQRKRDDEHTNQQQRPPQRAAYVAADLPQEIDPHGDTGRRRRRDELQRRLPRNPCEQHGAAACPRRPALVV
jgi:hypothetical protein